MDPPETCPGEFLQEWVGSGRLSFRQLRLHLTLRSLGEDSFVNITQKVFLDLGGDAWESCKGEMFVEGVLCECDRYFSGQGNKFQSPREWARCVLGNLCNNV